MRIMSKRSRIRCVCNQPITAQDIIQIGVYLQVDGPQYILLRFHCPHCHQVGEMVIEHKLLGDSSSPKLFSELTEQEKEKFSKMGEITTDELIDFHFALEKFKSFREKK